MSEHVSNLQQCQMIKIEEPKKSGTPKQRGTISHDPALMDTGGMDLNELMADPIYRPMIYGKPRIKTRVDSGNDVPVILDNNDLGLSLATNDDEPIKASGKSRRNFLGQEQFDHSEDTKIIKATAYDSMVEHSHEVIQRRLLSLFSASPCDSSNDEFKFEELQKSVRKSQPDFSTLGGEI